MKRILADEEYCIKIPFEHRHTVKEAGFKFDNEDKFWKTLNPFFANKVGLTKTLHQAHASSSFYKEYFPYQKLGLHRAWESFQEYDFHCIGDVMGLGKTPQAIGVARLLCAKRIAIICLANSRQVWVDHIYGNLNHKPNPIYRWGQELADVKTDVLYSTSEGIHYPHHLICSYSLALKLLDRSGDFDFIILDELQALSNPNAKQTKAVLDFCERNIEKIGAKVLGLSGTWPKNCPIELWPVLHRIGPKFFKQFSYRQFAERYCKPWTNPKNGAYIVSGFRRTEELNFNLKNLVMTRREIHEVRDDLPDPIFHFVELEATHEIESALKEEKEIYNRLSSAQKKSMSLGDYATARKRVALYKAPYISRYIKSELTEGRNKLCIFCHTVDLSKELESELKHFSPVRITGEVPAKKRDALVEKFQTNPECRVFIGNIQAAGMAITLTAASTLFFAETSWVPGDNDQVIGRIRRHGQTEQVHVKFLVVKGSLDEQILRRAYEKKQGLDEVLNKKG